jgi:peptidoglycan-associated lipoprotein
MKKLSPVQGIALAFLCTLLVAGCANKIAPSPVAEDNPVPTETVTSTDSETGVQEAVVDDATVGDQQTAMKEQMAVKDMEQIHFAFNQVTLSPEARDTLAANAALLQAIPDMKVNIEGYCDQRGSDEYNLALGERRAQAAMNYLVSLGVAKDRLATISYGEEHPLDPASNEEAWAKNRRDEFRIVR